MDETPLLVSGDVVALLISLQELGVVQRTHEEVHTHTPWPSDFDIRLLTPHPTIDRNAFQSFTITGVPPKGFVLVEWMHTKRPDLIPQPILKHFDRTLLIGDIVKRKAQDAMSGVVVNTFITCTLQPMGDIVYRQIYDKPLKGLMSMLRSIEDLRPANLPGLLVVPGTELQNVEYPMEEDIVVYKDHVGQVSEMKFVLTIKLNDNCVVEIDDDFANHVDGTADVFYVGDIASTKKGHLRTGRWIYGSYNPNTPPFGTVVQTRAVAARILWVPHSRPGISAPNIPPQILEREELESGDLHVFDISRQPPTSPSGTQGATSGETVSNHDINLRVGLRVRFRDFASACDKYDGTTPHGKITRLDRQDHMGYDLNVFDIIKMRTEVSVQWQDLSITRELAIDLMPDDDVEDTHAVWPGEIVNTVDLAPVPGEPNVEQPSKVGIVQTVNASQRMANIRWCPSGLLQLTHDPDQETGQKTIVSTIVGKASGEPQEVSVYDLEAVGEINVRRGDIVVITNKRWLRDNAASSGDNIDWVGMIVDTRLDGTTLLRLSVASPVRDVVLHREDYAIAIRMEESGQDSLMQDDDEGYYDHDDDSMYADDEDAGYDEFTEQAVPVATYEDENGEHLDEDDVDGGDWESDNGGEDVTMADADEEPSLQPQGNTEESPTVTIPLPPASGQASSAAWSTFSDAPEQYLILSSEVPASHPWSTRPATATPIHAKRTQKEHKILRTSGSLPQGVYIRTWESRLDLIRALIIGPEQTPYAHAPFIMDFYLPSDFPTNPPLVFFHSWSPVEGGAGRVNPNLYEDGKICLSILGTWEGDSGEGWNAVRSTLLQVIVSLLGLVLVPEPYYNEAGFEHLAGLEISKRASALYSERTFNRARGFAVTALSRLRDLPESTDEDGNQMEPTGLEGVADIIKWLYSDPQGPRLIDLLVADVEQVLEESEKDATAEPDGKKIMSKGACVPLRRLLERLRGFK